MGSRVYDKAKDSILIQNAYQTYLAMLKNKKDSTNQDMNNIKSNLILNDLTNENNIPSDIEECCNNDSDYISDFSSY